MSDKAEIHYNVTIDDNSNKYFGIKLMVALATFAFCLASTIYGCMSSVTNNSGCKTDDKECENKYEKEQKSQRTMAIIFTVCFVLSLCLYCVLDNMNKFV